jgi:hypothetical protein
LTESKIEENIIESSIDPTLQELTVFWTSDEERFYKVFFKIGEVIKNNRNVDFEFLSETLKNEFQIESKYFTIPKDENQFRQSTKLARLLQFINFWKVQADRTREEEINKEKANIQKSSVEIMEDEKPSLTETKIKTVALEVKSPSDFKKEIASKPDIPISEKARREREYAKAAEARHKNESEKQFDKLLKFGFEYIDVSELTDEEKEVLKNKEKEESKNVFIKFRKLEFKKKVEERFLKILEAIRKKSSLNMHISCMQIHNMATLRYLHSPSIDMVQTVVLDYKLPGVNDATPEEMKIHLSIIYMINKEIEKMQSGEDSVFNTLGLNFSNERIQLKVHKYLEKGQTLNVSVSYPEQIEYNLAEKQNAAE